MRNVCVLELSGIQLTNLFKKMQFFSSQKNIINHEQKEIKFIISENSVTFRIRKVVQLYFNLTNAE